MTTAALITTLFLVIEYAIKIIAIGVVPENRRPGAAQAWLLLILFLPLVGLPLFLLIGSPYVRGRRHRIQGQANQLIRDYTASYPMLPATAEASPAVTSLVGLNRTLASLPCVLGVNRGLHADYEESISAITRAVRAAEQYVHVEMYIFALDSTTADFFNAMGDAVHRGVKVRLLYDHLGSRGYPGFKEMDRRLTEDGIEWHRLMPIDLRRGRWRRPDLRNHRKLVVVDGSVAFMGSQNMIDSSYLKRANVKVGRHWVDLNIELGG
ncbi:MAG: cls, partial [Propionibacteriaceae bacterium]|nr:cls [Propionibacteriaceae bacterium]